VTFIQPIEVVGEQLEIKIELKPKNTNENQNEKQFELELFEQLKAEIIKKVDEIENIQQPKKIDRNLIIELNKEGKSQKEIAEIIGCKPHTICTILKQENIQHQRMRTIDVEKVLKLKEKFGIGNGKVAKMLGYSKGSIQRAIKKYETRN
jgi:transposase